MQNEKIVIKGAKQHNLKNISLELPKNKLIVFTGVSGSGKSSLAFDTLYAEGQRRYVESLSSYARQFLGLMEKPEVESITGLSPSISIDQKTSGSNPRSTVGTITEIYGYLRLLYGHIGTPHCPKCGSEIKSQTIQQIASQIEAQFKEDEKFKILSPLVRNRKGEYSGLFEKLLSKGFLRVIVDENTYHLDDIDDINLNQNKKHNISLIVDRLKGKDNWSEEDHKRLIDSLEVASNMSDGEVVVKFGENEKFFSEKFTCFKCNISYPKITPASFSFNAPEGACPNCTGLGRVKQIDVKKIYNPKLTILEGGIFPWSNQMTKDTWNKRLLEAVAKEHGFDLKTKIGKYPKEIFDLIFYGKGAKDYYKITYTNRYGKTKDHKVEYEGVVNEQERLYKETDSDYRRSKIEEYMQDEVCKVCNGQRLKKFSLAVTINNKNIIDLTQMPIKELDTFFSKLKLEGNDKEIAHPILKEIRSRVKFLINVGLNYLTLSRKANTLSGGESQRIRLASQIGTGLSGVLYVLDEPSVGLHPRDVSKLISSLENLRDTGNTVIVVEHDENTIESADHILDIGPKAGKKGGEIVGQGDVNDIKQTNSLTAKYLNRDLQVGENIKDKVQEKNTVEENNKLSLIGVRTHNLKALDLHIPLNTLTCITGVSGSGKSSLINDTLYPALMNRKMNGKQVEGRYEDIYGLEPIDKVIGIDQSPIGRTPRSNPATYTGVFTPIRKLFAETQEARARGYDKGRFSFNVKGGRCGKCRGDGQIKVEMQFLPDMYITCDECGGKRYNEEVLDIDYKGKNIAQVLQMTVDEALQFFKSIPPISRRLKVLQDVGLGYIQLGQSAITLSGGESQRIKLSKELAKMTRGHTVYILDEPTTGLHFYDVDKLLVLLRGLVDRGDSVIIIEHNLDVIKQADWIVDLGPEGGEKGGKIVVQGSIEDVKVCEKSYTGQWLKKKDK
jgi:excinuclease ABC subunit A